ncbi:MAG: tRNA 4-thiouridine(8) synthase ThiI [Treponema sp.]|jgi:thiamine biosynthesis protein ThiI|nr:tRNA 4-thiouridine(8) synthase ThiI [Treponema sp.]
MPDSPAASYLLKLGELTLKGENRGAFEQVLKRNIRAMLKGTGAQLLTTDGRYFIFGGASRDAFNSVSEDASENTFQDVDASQDASEKKIQDADASQNASEKIEFALNHLFGIAGWAKTRCREKSIEAVCAECIAEARDLLANGVKTFKVEARRTDKRFPLDSYGLMAATGEAVLAALPALKVDVHKPEAVITVEIREKAYIYGNARKGLRGLPVGTAGRGLLLLSGGIDSPVAGFLMAGRGMDIDAVHFHSYPYTSEEARDKVVRLAEILGCYTLGVRLHIVGFTKVQMRIKEAAPPAWSTILLRMAMMEAAEFIARQQRCKCLISGESLSQVASQTIENIHCTESRTTLPILRPLIGMDKESIIRIAEKISAYKTSILPYEDCCVLFSSKHPELRGDVGEAAAYYERLEISALIEEAVRERDVEKCSFVKR